MNAYEQGWQDASMFVTNGLHQVYDTQWLIVALLLMEHTTMSQDDRMSYALAFARRMHNMEEARREKQSERGGDE